MHAAAIRVELRIRDSRSLKEKRRTLKPLIADLRRTFEVSVAEVDHQDLWQRATLGIAVVAPQAGHLNRIILSIERSLRARLDVEVLGSVVGHLEAST
jgi:uncharacterized protein YlxP (DUF503 family)